ncbi:hypothetical protein CFC21_092631 [Triticum aestivum]|uniref:HMA domain-containing protein n=4 Tax=Triticinae TaxID=1648030 RepID=A0A453NWT3_AEGTS|nr:RNA-binding protein FUS [Aegilops tauschii subsp. strangulata]XP_044416538.1 RNA-binding protein FUS-like isoform X1 [Triticum aestivum]KAF7089743.1 hypothetical protein CFC21_092631 [Triticum aestivum]
MRKEIIIRMYVNSEKYQTKAMKVAATASGVESVTLAGGDKNLLLVIGDDVDSNKLTKSLKKKVGAAEIVELRTLDTFGASSLPLPPGTKGPVAPYNGSQHYQYGAAPGPYAYHHHPSPLAAQGGYGYGYGYGSSYSRAVARSHPGNYSPLVERHDYYPMEHSSSSGSGGGGGGSSSTSYSSVPRRDSGSGGCCIQ